MILSIGINVWNAHVLMRFCHLNKSFAMRKKDVMLEFFIIHSSEVILLFEPWIILENLQYILLSLRIWTLTFYHFRLHVYILGPARTTTGLSEVCFEFQSFRFFSFLIKYLLGPCVIKIKKKSMLPNGQKDNRRTHASIPVPLTC